MARSGNSSKFPEPNRDSFGARFGALMLARRGVEGLTQQQLAVRAFGEEGRVNRISELENGKVAKPQQKTVDALVVALAITEQDLRDCGVPSVPSLPEGFAAELGLAEGLLGRLAWDFGHDKPRASAAEYQRFLRDKADELRTMRTELEALKDADARLGNQVAAAEAALDAGEIEEAEAILASARELSQERSLQAVRQTADIIALQGLAALLRNDVDAAFGAFTSAADMVGALAPTEAHERRCAYSDALRIHGDRFPGPALADAVALAEANLRTCSRTDHPTDWARTQNNLANALQILGKRTGGDAGRRALERAVAAYEAALQVFTRDAMPANWGKGSMALGMARVRLGLATDNRTLVDQGANGIDEALEVYTTVASEADVEAARETRAAAQRYLDEA